MRIVWMLREVTYAPVILATLEMELLVMVSGMAHQENLKY